MVIIQDAVTTVVVVVVVGGGGGGVVVDNGTIWIYICYIANVYPDGSI